MADSAACTLTAMVSPMPCTPWVSPIIGDSPGKPAVTTTGASPKLRSAGSPVDARDDGVSDDGGRAERRVELPDTPAQQRRGHGRERPATRPHRRVLGAPTAAGHDHRRSWRPARPDPTPGYKADTDIAEMVMRLRGQWSSPSEPRPPTSTGHRRVRADAADSAVDTAANTPTVTVGPGVGAVADHGPHARVHRRVGRWSAAQAVSAPGAGTSPASVSRTNRRCARAAATKLCHGSVFREPRGRHRRNIAHATEQQRGQRGHLDDRRPAHARSAAPPRSPPRRWRGCRSTSVNTCSRHGHTRGSSLVVGQARDRGQAAAQLSSAKSCTANCSACTSRSHPRRVCQHAAVVNPQPQLRHMRRPGRESTSTARSRLAGSPPNAYSETRSLGISADIQYICASTAASRRTRLILPGQARPMKSMMWRADHIRLLELQEVPGAFDDEGAAARLENPLDPRDVVRCHAAVVVAVQIQDGYRGRLQKERMQVRVFGRPVWCPGNCPGTWLLRRASSPAHRSRPQRARRRSASSYPGDHCRHSRGTTRNAERSGSQGNWKYMMYQLRSS